MESSQLVAELLTLYTSNGLVDPAAFRKQIGWVVPSVTGLFVGGLAGDGLILPDEYLALQMQIAVEESMGIPVWQGILPVGTDDALKQIDKAYRRRAHAVIVAGPRNQSEWHTDLEQFWFDTLTHSPLPIIVYDEPKLSARFPTDVVVDLLRHPSAAGYKDSTKDLIHASLVLSKLPQLTYYSGSDGLTWPLMALGACGVISLLVDPFPKLLRELVDNAHAFNLLMARTLHHCIVEIRQVLTRWPNQEGYKNVLQAYGIGQGSAVTPGFEQSQLLTDIEMVQNRFPGISIKPFGR